MLAKNVKMTRAVRIPASSLTTIASVLAPTEKQSNRYLAW
jgi:hypothetical protein